MLKLNITISGKDRNELYHNLYDLNINIFESSGVKKVGIGKSGYQYAWEIIDSADDITPFQPQKQT
jgi:hypothetical protein